MTGRGKYRSFLRPAMRQRYSLLALSFSTELEAPVTEVTEGIYVDVKGSKPRSVARQGLCNLETKDMIAVARGQEE